MDYPTRRVSLKATREGREVWCSLIPLKKPYICRACQEWINIGAEAVVTRYAGKIANIRTDHFLYHRHCFWEKLLPKLDNIKEIPPKDAEKGRVSKVLRRRRYQQRRRAR